jgi:hypothetical protein
MADSFIRVTAKVSQYLYRQTATKGEAQLQVNERPGALDSTLYHEVQLFLRRYLYGSTYSQGPIPVAARSET